MVPDNRSWDIAPKPIDLSPGALVALTVAGAAIADTCVVGEGVRPNGPHELLEEEVDSIFVGEVLLLKHVLHKEYG